MAQWKGNLLDVEPSMLLLNSVSFVVATIVLVVIPCVVEATVTWCCVELVDSFLRCRGLFLWMLLKIFGAGVTIPLVEFGL